MSARPGGEGAPQRGWWSRHWKWVVPTGCLGLLLSCGCLGALLVGLTLQALRDTAAYVEAVALATHSPEVRQALGEDVRAGLFVRGSIETEDEFGTASFTVPLEGSKGQGTLRVEAYKQGEDWRFTTLQVDVPRREPIELLAGQHEPPPHTRPYPDEPPVPEPPLEDTPPE